MEDTDMRVKTTAINLQNDLVLTDKKGSLLPRKLYMYLGLEIPHDNIKILQQLGISEYGPLYDAKIYLQLNVKSRTLVKVCKI